MFTVDEIIDFSFSTISQVTEGEFNLKKRLKKDLFEHSLRVAKYSVAIGIESNMNLYELVILGVGGLLHDIGKRDISDDILYTKDELTRSEWQLIQSHTSIGFRLVKPYNFDERILDIVLHHHEKLDSSGYPSGECNLSEFVQIVTIADIFDAVSVKRVYHKKRDIDEALNILKCEKGLNKCMVKVLEKLVKEKGYIAEV
jgi:putative nucleotidyltransferase with HDIG domain